MRAEELTIAEALGAAGYATGCFGKWHNGAHYPMHPNGQGFDEFVGFCAGHWNNYFDTLLEDNGEVFRSKGYISDVLTDAAIGFIDEHRNEPFFCYVPYNAPHGPFQVPGEYLDKYTDRDCDALLASVYGMCDNIDRNAGRVLARIDELGLAEDTIVIFLTDNGPNTARYNGGMRGRKGSVHEGGVRVPFFMRWPGHIPSGKTVDRIAGHVDVMPTLMELCEVTAPDGPPMTGASVAPLLLGDGETWADRSLFTHQSRNGQVFPAPGSIRTQQYRMANEGKQGWQLFDMDTDPGEQSDIAADHPEVVQQLSREYDAWFADATAAGFDRIPVPVGHPERAEVELQAPEAFFAGDVHFRGKKGWANDWITGMESPNDYAWWDIDVVREGTYEITLMYHCPESDVGSTVQVEIGEETVAATVSEAFDPEPVPSPDRVERGEVYEYEWAPLTVGEVGLKPGRQELAVKATEIPGEAAMDLMSVRLRRVE